MNEGNTVYRSNKTLQFGTCMDTQYEVFVILLNVSLKHKIVTSVGKKHFHFIIFMIKLFDSMIQISKGRQNGGLSTLAKS